MQLPRMKCQNHLRTWCWYHPSILQRFRPHHLGHLPLHRRPSIKLGKSMAVQSKAKYQLNKTSKFISYEDFNNMI